MMGKFEKYLGNMMKLTLNPTRKFGHGGAGMRAGSPLPPAPGTASSLRPRISAESSSSRPRAASVAPISSHTCIDRLFGRKPSAPGKPQVLVLDNGPIHVTKASRAALPERAYLLTRRAIDQIRAQIERRRDRAERSESTSSRAPDFH
jgi:hypothetical protein